MSISGKAIIFCAPSGAGKTTIVRHLIRTIPHLKFSISATTRSPRSNETHGKDYYFLKKSAFLESINQEQFYEWEEVYEGMYYGTLKEEVDRIWSDGDHVIFDVDVVGGINLKKELGKRALAVFVSVENIAVLEQRLRHRNTETEDTLKMRVAKAAHEIKQAPNFDYTLINKELNDALTEAETLVLEFISQ